MSFDIKKLSVSKMNEIMDYLANSMSVEETAAVYEIDSVDVLNLMIEYENMGRLYKEVLDELNKDNLSFEF